mmetsp:Transcript_10187/g.31322  ORF Transcript_10187/g.31322 Transcript_10187/m.31322 type:complete len:170 (+) Transcript_10187:2493-3002(+)
MGAYEKKQADCVASVNDERVHKPCDMADDARRGHLDKPTRIASVVTGGRDGRSAREAAEVVEHWCSWLPDVAALGFESRCSLRPRLVCELSITLCHTALQSALGGELPCSPWTHGYCRWPPRLREPACALDAWATLSRFHLHAQRVRPRFCAARASVCSCAIVLVICDL